MYDYSIRDIDKNNLFNIESLFELSIGDVIEYKEKYYEVVNKVYPVNGWRIVKRVLVVEEVE